LLDLQQYETLALMQVSRRITTILAFALSVGACNSDSVQPQPKIVELPDFERLGSLAEKQCLCAMAGRSNEKVSLEFNRLTTGLQAVDLGSASAPLSASIRCFPQYGRDNACVTLSYSFVVTTEREFVCTSDQADELESIWNAQVAKRGGSRNHDDALLKGLKVMRREVASSLSQATCDNP
jgi:hypothetical protein